MSAAFASWLPDTLSSLVGNLAAYKHVSSQAAAPLMETAMDDKKPDARTIAAEEVGEARGVPIPDAAKDKPATEEVIRQLATSA